MDKESHFWFDLIYGIVMFVMGIMYCHFVM